MSRLDTADRYRPCRVQRTVALMSAERARRATIIAQKFARQGDTSAAKYWEEKAENYRKAGK